MLRVAKEARLETSTMTTRTINPWDWDLRVRERNVRAGLITPKDLEKVNSALVDLEGNTDEFTLAQPALDEEDDFDDDEEDDVAGESTDTAEA